MWDQRRGELWARMETHFHTTELHRQTLEDHGAIVAALEAHRQDAARLAMHRHLDRVAREFQRRWDRGAARATGH
jgi:DNA-binding FadR family transcriptional regulator